MAEVTLTLNGRAYRIACADGQEPHIERLGAYIEDKLQTLVQQVGQRGDALLLAMANLMIADELAEARGSIDDQAATPVGGGTDEAAAAIEQAALRIDALAASLEAS